jgi:hypothetical protein
MPSQRFRKEPPGEPLVLDQQIRAGGSVAYQEIRRLTITDPPKRHLEKHQTHDRDQKRAPSKPAAAANASRKVPRSAEGLLRLGDCGRMLGRSFAQPVEANTRNKQPSSPACAHGPSTRLCRCAPEAPAPRARLGLSCTSYRRDVECAGRAKRRRRFPFIQRIRPPAYAPSALVFRESGAARSFPPYSTMSP